MSFYKDSSEHNNLSIIKSVPIKLEIYNFVYFLNDGRLAVNTDNKLNIYSADFKKIEQTINDKSIYITQLKDNSLVNCVYNGANIYKYEPKKKKFKFHCSLKCINNSGKLIELQNGQLALNSNDSVIQIFNKDKENGNYIEEGKELDIITINDFIQINENELASISHQESEITFWNLITREINMQIGKIKNFGRSCLILYDKTLIVGGGGTGYTGGNFIYIINVESHELINKYIIHSGIWFMIKLNENEFITGDSEGYIKRYRYEENIIKKMDINNDHKNTVEKLAYNNNNYLASLSERLLIIFKICE